MLSVIVHGTPKKVAVILLSKITAFQGPFLLKSYNEEKSVSQIDLVFLRTSALVKMRIYSKWGSLSKGIMSYILQQPQQSALNRGC